MRDAQVQMVNLLFTGMSNFQSRPYMNNAADVTTELTKNHSYLELLDKSGIPTSGGMLGKVTFTFTS